MTRRFDVEGNELKTERIYQFEVSTDRPSYNWVERNILGHGEASAEEVYADTLNWAMTGSLERGRVQAGGTATLTFSESQMQALLEQTRARVD